VKSCLFFHKAWLLRKNNKFFSGLGIAEEASGPPAESEAPGTEINRFTKTKKL
jgi:hypothetical protein